MGDADPVARFALAATRYCAWAEQPPAAAEPELRNALVLLLDLVRAALDPPRVEAGDAEEPRIAHEAWKRMHARFASVPGPQHYGTASPADVLGEVTVGNLHDDLADVWRDPRGPLDLFQAGLRDDAVWFWRFGFAHHWGEHAGEAIRVLVARAQLPA